MSRICEEFPACTPETALHQPLPLTLAIMELRAYVRARQAVKGAHRPEDIPQGPLTALVYEVEQDAYQWLADQRKQGSA